MLEFHTCCILDLDISVEGPFKTQNIRQIVCRFVYIWSQEFLYVQKLAVALYKPRVSMLSLACVQNWNMSSPVASWVFTHLYGGTVHSGRSHTEPSGHWLCQRRGKGSLSQGTRGNGECCVTTRNLESGQRAVPLQDGHKWLFTHKSPLHKDSGIHYTQTSTHTCKRFRQSRARTVANLESTAVIQHVLFAHFLLLTQKVYWSVPFCKIVAVKSLKNWSHIFQ